MAYKQLTIKQFTAWFSEKVFRAVRFSEKYRNRSLSLKWSASGQDEVTIIFVEYKSDKETPHTKSTGRKLVAGGRQSATLTESHGASV